MIPTAGFSKHAVWIFGALVGLALEEAITGVAPHIFAFNVEAESSALVAHEALRLCVFCVMSVRFYLGAAHLFEEFHATELTPQTADPTTGPEAVRLRQAARRFGVDFFAGLLHFSVFSAWSVTLRLHPLSASEAAVPPQWVFGVVLTFLLTYDLWWLIGRKLVGVSAETRTIKTWTLVNLLTATVLVGSYEYLVNSLNWERIDAEVPGLLVVVVVSLFDIAALTMGISIFETTLVVFLKLIAESLRKGAAWLGGIADRIHPRS